MMNRRKKTNENSCLYFCYGGCHISYKNDSVYFFNKKIKSKFVRSFLYYIPYAVLSAMTIPAIFYSTGNIATAVIGTLTAAILAFFNLPLIVVAVAAALAAFISGFFM